MSSKQFSNTNLAFSSEDSSRPTPSTQIEKIVFSALKRYAWLAEESAELPMHSSFPELGIDSMTIISISLELEQAIGCVFPDDFYVVENFRSPAVLITSIDKMIKGNSS